MRLNTYLKFTAENLRAQIYQAAPRSHPFLEYRWTLVIVQRRFSFPDENMACSRNRGPNRYLELKSVFTFG
jgi:hypothetical protein